MSLLIPARPVVGFTKGTIRLLQALKALPDTWVVWSRIDGNRAVPDFFALHRPTRSAFLLSALGPRAGKPGDVAEDEQILSLDGFLPPGLRAQARRILFRHDRDQAEPEWNRSLEALGIEFLGRKDAGASLETWLLSRKVQTLSKSQEAEIRSRFTPESQLFLPMLDAQEPALVDAPRRFLDLRQEELAKRDLFFPPEGKRLASDLRVRLLAGVAGAGKTLVLLHRACLLGRSFPKGRSLVLTYNRPLRSEIQRRLDGMDAPRNVQAWTFYSWCAHAWKGQGHRELVQGREKFEILQDLGFDFGFRKPRDVERMQGEIDWIHEQGHATWEQYEVADRSGRGFRLSASQREKIWAATLLWRDYLDRNLLGDYPHFGFRFAMALENGLQPVDLCDHILVDEAQFFAPTWFQVVRSHLKPHGSLFLCADPTQGFLRRGNAWKSVGLEVRGRTDRLSRSYRSTRQILKFAWDFLGARKLELDDDSVVPDLERLPEGPEPRLVPLQDPDGEIRWMAAEVAEDAARGVSPSASLVILTDPVLVGRAREALQSRGIRSDLAEDPFHADACRVTTIEKATGLEAPIVYVLGATELLEAEDNPETDDEDSAILRERNARRLYMAFTRAGQSLRIGWRPGRTLA